MKLAKRLAVDLPDTLLHDAAWSNLHEGGIREAGGAVFLNDH